MSAFQCSDEIIGKVASYLTREEFTTDATEQELGHALAQMNDRAVSHNRGVDPQDIPYTHSYVWVDTHKLAMEDIPYMCGWAKTLACFLYQCSEGDVPEERLFKRVQQADRNLRDSIIAALPPYKEARWG